MGLAEKIQTFVDCQGIRAEDLLVAVSGGPDSVALLLALVELRDRRPLSPGRLVVAHLNHRLRGEESDADEAFVRELGRALGNKGARLRCEQSDVRARALAEKGNLEDVARRIRYGWLAKVASEENVHFVATGHTMDDQAETVLHRILRGTGFKGLAGIASRLRIADGIEVVRPLLQATRREVLVYLRDRGQGFRIDTSNQDLHFTRNRIRRELLPHLAEHYNPAIVSVLCRMAEQSAEAFADCERLAADCLAESERPRAGLILVFEAAKLASQPRSLVREVFRMVWSRESWPLGEMGYGEWNRLAALVAGTASAVDLPGRIRARRRGTVVQIGSVE
jgi:tRNA(Ile)-lysidine synthase